jgi:PhnB protein
VTTSRMSLDFKPRGWLTVTPRIVVPDARGLVKFIQDVFGATGDYRSDTPAILHIGGDSMIMVSDAGARDTGVAFLYVYVADTDETYRRAISAGAQSLEEPSDLPYGDRRGMVQDRWGNTWQIATRLGNG